MYSQIFIVSLIVIPGLRTDKNDCTNVSHVGRTICSRFPKYFRFYQRATCHSNEYITKSRQVSCNDDLPFCWITCTLDLTGRTGGKVNYACECKKGRHLGASRTVVLSYTTILLSLFAFCLK